MPDQNTPDNSVKSYAWVHTAMAAKSQSFADKFNQFVVEYVIEWDRIMSTRVANGSKVTDQLRRDLDHYQKKVEALRQSANLALAKGKMVDAKSQDKLSRNEEKLIKAKQDYDKVALDMCMLLEEYTERAWKDLHPALVKLAQFDSTVSSDEAASLKELDQVVSQLKAIGDKYDLSGSGRLKDLEKTPPAQLYSKEGGFQQLSNEAANDGGYMGGTSGDANWGAMSALPPGSVAPQGMGGYPVPVASPIDEPPRPTPAPSPGFSRQGSVTSLNSGTSSFNSGRPMTTSDMLTVANSAAPPPTLDQVNDAAQSLSINPYGQQPSAAPYGGMLQSTPSYSRSASVTSVDSYPYAPAPAAPPPPPPPAANGMSMYSSFSDLTPVPPSNQPNQWGVPAGAPPAAPPSGGYGANPFGDPPAGHNPFGSPPSRDPPASANPFAF
eukprot:CAMPEP_0116565112 /NCGR_PEP_ID=MMETSP0397-20121206/13720_1 /TAXON_ID=216820 /ORGANISM="Cyclophora tenuis, Strain ECT3854" /LENGTH=437 /DNA_ID=CAMNT_0004091855 /DNA_START=63 /DNA_END=1376 /DNA_ORIENTATION=+